MEHGAYRQMLDFCWDQRGPLPLDERRIFAICNARSAEEMGAVRNVLAEFFVKMDDGHYNKRIQQEIERCSVISGKRAGAAHERWNARAKLKGIASHNANAMQVHSTSNANGPSPSPSPSLTQEPEDKKTTRAPRTSPSVSGLEGITPQVASDWMALRKAKRAAVTPTAIRGIQREADKAGITLEAALAMCCQRGWAGFKAEWLAEQPKRWQSAEPAGRQSSSVESSAEYLRSQQLTPEQREKAKAARELAVAAMNGTLKAMKGTA